MLRRVVLLAALALLVMPTAALADGIDFGVFGGALNLTGSLELTNSPGGSILGSVGRIPSGSGPADFGNFGTMLFTTGAFVSSTATSATFGAGGSLVINSNATYQTATGIAPQVLFNGGFSGPTTLALVGQNNQGLDIFQLSGLVSGNVAAALYAYMGLPNVNPADGFILTLVVQTNAEGGLSISSGDINVSSVPEPGTLALFGTGLLGLAGLVRRRLNV